MSRRGIEHVVSGGFCLQCGDLADWLAESLGPEDSIVEA